MKIAIGSDHAGFAYKEAIIVHLQGRGHTVTDFGTYSSDSTDYPIFVIPPAEGYGDVGEAQEERAECDADDVGGPEVDDEAPRDQFLRHPLGVGVQQCDVAAPPCSFAL